MKFFMVRAVIICLLPVASYKAMAEVRKRFVDIKHIALDMKFNWQKKQAYGTATIRLSPLTATNRFSLDTAYLTISSIRLANHNSLKFSCDSNAANDNLKIYLDRVYQPNENIAITINYHTKWVNTTDPNSIWGSNGKGIRFFEPSSTEPNRKKQIWSMGEGEGNRYWFPCYDAPNDLRTTEFTATVEKEFTVISNGKLVSKKNNGDGTYSFHYKMERSYPNHKTAFVVGEYAAIQQQYNGITLYNFCYKDETEAAIATIERLPDMVKYFSAKTGQPYPLPAYTQVFVNELPWGNSNSTFSTQTENMIDAGLSFKKPKHFSKIKLNEGDHLVIPGSKVAYLLSPEFKCNKSLFDWIKTLHQNKVKLVSICVGAFVLAQSGLLNGIKCTTHFKLTQKLQTLYPKTTVIENILFTEENNIYTSAGIASGLDLLLHIVEQLKGSYFSYKVARELVIYNRRDGSNAQHSVFMQYRNHIHSGVHKAQDFIIENIHRKPYLIHLAAEACMSERNFTRIFKRETGITVVNYITAIRKEMITKLLQTENFNYKQIANRIGLESEKQVVRILNS